MGHTNSTANLSLPQFIGTDKPTWLGDVNGAFGAIDTAVGTINADILAVDAKADNAVADASSAVNVANNASTTAGNASTTATTANNIANNALTVANNADGHTNQLEMKVGLLADLTTTDKTSIVNAINEVNGSIGTPSASQVSYDNTGSSLTATNVQDAIDEVAQGEGGGVSEIATAISTGTETRSQLLDILGAHLSDINEKAFITFERSGKIFRLDLVNFTANDASFSSTDINSGSFEVTFIKVKASGSEFGYFTTTYSDGSSGVESAGFKFTLYS